MAEDTSTGATSTSKKSNKWKKPLLVVLVLIVGGVLGYLVGVDTTETDLHKKYLQQISELETELAEAKREVGGTLEEGQESAESLQAENAQLQSTIDQQEQRIEQLEAQLEDAQSEQTPPAEQ